MPKLEPLSDHVLVLEVHQEQTVEGVLLPDMAREDMKVGKVLAIGQEVRWLRTNETVIFGPYAGMPVSLEGVQFLLLREGEVKGRLTQ